VKQFRISNFGFRIWPRAICIVALALSLLAAPVPSPGQQPGKVYRIGYLGNNAFAPTEEIHPQRCPVTGAPSWQAFMAGLRERGYVPGQNLFIECRWTEARAERAPGFASELVSLKPDLLVAGTTANVRAAKQATSTIPIVMISVINPVERGVVPSLARPGGNVTGLTDAPLETEGKRLQLLKEAVPKASRVAYLFYSTGESTSGFREERDAAARALGVTLQVYAIREPTELVGSFAAMVKAQAEAFFLEAHPFWYGHRHRLIELAAQNRLPAMYHDREFVTAGGLMVYDVDRLAIFRRLGSYVDRILKGANPGDLPVEQPTKFDLVINLKTAKALGLTIPPAMLMRAEVIE